MTYYIFDTNKKPLGVESRSSCDFSSKSLSAVSKKMNMFFRYLVQLERDEYEFLPDRALTFEEHLKKAFAGSYFRVIKKENQTDLKIPFADLIGDSQRRLRVDDFI